MSADQPSLVVPKPAPSPGEITRFFWDAAREHRLVVQRCDGCGAYRFPPEVACFYCGSLRASWTPVTGRAVLYSWTVAHPPLLPYFQERSPWLIAVVQLEEGPRLITNLAGIAPEECEIGMPLECQFEEIDDGVTLITFRRR